jgi:hypothetical protein
MTNTNTTLDTDLRSGVFPQCRIAAAQVEIDNAHSMLPNITPPLAFELGIVARSSMLHRQHYTLGLPMQHLRDLPSTTPTLALDALKYPSLDF